MNYNEAKKNFIQAITKLEYKYSKWDIFSDFCRMSAISLYQPFARSEKLENEYLSIVKKYDKQSVNIFPELLFFVVEGLSSSFGDFLGECFMELDLGSKHKGQFFTPYSISKFMSQILGDKVKEKEFLSEPACGSSGMIIARAEVLKEQGLNYQKIMQVEATEIDLLCFNMSYIHLTLLHINAKVIYGNSLSLEIFDSWYTPAYYLNADRTPKIKNDLVVVNETINKETAIFEDIYSKEDLNTFSKGRLF